MTEKTLLTQKQKIDLGKQAKELANKQRIQWELGIEPIPDIF
jgi:hypothetical protein